MFACELFAMLATAQWPKEEVRGRKLIRFVGNAAACSDLTKGTAGHDRSLILLYSLWVGAARFGSSIWIDKVPSDRNPADGLSRDQMHKLMCELLSERGLACLLQRKIPKI